MLDIEAGAVRVSKRLRLLWSREARSLDETLRELFQTRDLTDLVSLRAPAEELRAVDAWAKSLPDDDWSGVVDPDQEQPIRWTDEGWVPA